MTVFTLACGWIFVPFFAAAIIWCPFACCFAIVCNEALKKNENKVMEKVF
jgi:hypothetical protein